MQFWKLFEDLLWFIFIRGSLTTLDQVCLLYMCIKTPRGWQDTALPTSSLLPGSRAVQHCTGPAWLGFGPKPVVLHPCTAQQANTMNKHCLLSFITLWLLNLQTPKHRLTLNLLVLCHCCLWGHPWARRRFINLAVLTKWPAREFAQSEQPSGRMLISCTQPPEGTDKATLISVQDPALTGFRRNNSHKKPG